LYWNGSCTSDDVIGVRALVLSADVMASIEMEASAGGSSKGEKKRFEVKKVRVERTVRVTRAKRFVSSTQWNAVALWAWG
jgi:hypothetical protein